MACTELPGLPMIVSDTVYRHSLYMVSILVKTTVAVLSGYLLLEISVFY